MFNQLMVIPNVPALIALSAVVAASAKAKKHVLCEKPVGICAEDVELLMKTAEENKGSLDYTIQLAASNDEIVAKIKQEMKHSIVENIREL